MTNLSQKLPDQRTPLTIIKELLTLQIDDELTAHPNDALIAQKRTVHDAIDIADLRQIIHAYYTSDLDDFLDDLQFIIYGQT